jgi:serine/threonine protein kinase
VRFLARGFADGQFYFVMEFVDGIDAQKLVEERGGRVGAAEATNVILQVLEALEYA